jgi:RimJ/RimL family protein N-acetyltransferase
MINITTRRLIIRNFTSADWHDLQGILVDKEASEYAFTDHPFPTGEREVKDITNWFSQGDSFLAAYEITEKKVIGYIAINSENPSEYNLGYCFRLAYQEKGYATEGCAAVIDYVFETLKATRFVTGTAKSNISSCKLLAKLGFKKISESTESL